MVHILLRSVKHSGPEISCGHPHDPEEIIPVILLHPVFSQFVNDCQTGTMTEDNNQFIGKLANAMSDLYDDQAGCVWVVDQLFKEVHLNCNTHEKVVGIK